LCINCHQLTAWQKFGDKCLGAEILIRHIDDDADNFRLSNIKLGTREDNEDDRYINTILQNWIKEINEAANNCPF